MGSMLDIIGSVFIAGMVILNFAFFMDDKTSSEISSQNKIEMLTQMEGMQETMMSDLRKVGYGCDTLKVLRATATEFTFRSDIDKNGKIDTVRYAFLSTEVVNGNTETRTVPRLTRRVNRQATAGIDLNLASCSFIYLRKDGTVTTTASEVRAIRIATRVTSGTCNETAQSSLSEFVITPKNL